MSSYKHYRSFESNEAKPKRFITLSMFIHGLLAFGLLYFTLPLAEKLKEDQAVELKYGTEAAAEEAADLTTAAAGLTTAAADLTTAAAGLTTAAADLTTAAAGSDLESENSTYEEKVSKTAETASEKTEVAPAKTVQKEVKQVEEVIEESNPVVPSVAQSTLQSSEQLEVTDDGTELQKKKQEQVKEQAAVKQVAHQSQLIATEAALAKDMEEAMAEQDKMIAAISEQSSKDAEALAQNLKEVQEKNANALMVAKAAEEAKANEIKVTKAGAGGNDEQGESQKGASLTGTPEGIRTIEQLKQMPGNPKPQYDLQERLRHEQGSVIFQAYITKEGIPTDFRMIQSTGFRNLDKKALVALRKWKFYPGQEGWVELPFSWDLKGGEEEAPTTLRRYGSN